MQMLQRVPVEEWGQALAKEQNPVQREFWRAIDTAKKRVQRRKSFQPMPEHADAASAEPDPSAWLESVEGSEREHEAFELMLDDVTPRQADILRLIAEGHDAPAIAAALHTSAKIVHEEKYRALQRLKRLFGGSVA